MKNRKVKGFILLEACVGFTIACLGVLLLGITIKQNRQTEKRVDKAYAEYIFRHSDKKTLLVHDHVYHRK
ncbi:type II secretion system protein [Lactobacillus gasseri]|nr:type II secretion system protein [Lactobacillus gasseri]MCZ3672500.1 type II secretion system protein [Lactobacillus gasseri]MCZ3676698.1 type II secretion system protein [Lactobacillus gasseri]MCZ3678584.1 type II secretion system protein [Lactobacillus gasseri]MCZ3680460.1 type II secretion system protein [Lactobacillus gasseri]